MLLDAQLFLKILLCLSKFCLNGVKLSIYNPLGFMLLKTVRWFIMEQKIVCVGGKCFDMSSCECEEVFDDPVEIIECELMQRNYVS